MDKSLGAALVRVIAKLFSLPTGLNIPNAIKMSIDIIDTAFYEPKPRIAKKHPDPIKFAIHRQSYKIDIWTNIHNSQEKQLKTS